MDSKKFHFDDDKQNTYNVTVNHYHMAEPRSFVQEMASFMMQGAFVNCLGSLMGSTEREIEDTRERYRSKVLAIEDDAQKIQYEVHDEKELIQTSLNKLYNENGNIVLEVVFEYSIDKHFLKENYDIIVDSVKNLMSNVNKQTNEFIFIIKNGDFEDIKCGCIDSDYFSALINKFGKGKDFVIFSKEIGIKLEVPLINNLDKIDYIIGYNGFFKIEEDSNKKFHLTKLV